MGKLIVILEKKISIKYCKILINILLYWIIVDFKILLFLKNI